jgi:hypothetical protein
LFRQAFARLGVLYRRLRRLWLTRHFFQYAQERFDNPSACGAVDAQIADDAMQFGHVHARIVDKQ